VGLLTLRDVRGYLRRSHSVGLAVFIGVAYALAAMLAGGMLVLARYPGGYSVDFLWGNALGLQPWNYPLVLIEAPWGFVILPFFATVSMVAVAAGVGLGMAVAILLSVQLVRRRRSPAPGPATTGALAGLTPAMITLVTLGACCSTTAAATAGIGLVAQASGSSASNLLLNNWFLGVFQVAIVYVALIAQELLLRMYGRLFATDDPGFATGTGIATRLDRHTLAAGALRIALLAAGITWVLTVVAEWTTVPPGTASVGLWFNWLIEHWLVGGMAIVVALSPRSVLAAVGTWATKSTGYLARCLLVVGAWALGGWVPPPFSAMGVEGFGNEALGLVGAPASVGAVPPVFPPGVGLAFQWTFQYLLLAVFAGALAVYPARVLSWLSNRTPTPEVGRSPSLATTTTPAPLTVSR